MNIPGTRRLQLGVQSLRDAIRGMHPVNDPLRVPRRWILQPHGDLAGRNACVLVTLARAGKITEHGLFMARAWARQGFAVIIVIVTENSMTFETDVDLSFCHSVLVRDNVGYDFGAWSACLRLLPDVTDAALLAIANDSVFGPFDTLAAMIERVVANPADLVGVIGSTEHRAHLQSFLLFFKSAALRNPIFVHFWKKVRNGDRDWVIRLYEERLEERFNAGGVSTAALYPTHDMATGPRNLGIEAWRELIARGFPFIKIQLLRDNPLASDLTGWRQLLANQGYDPAIVERHFSLYSPAAAALLESESKLG